jgi:enoyl-[acyl-carrier protein] reductase II
MCGAMTWISDPKLVSVVGNCGGFRLLAGGNAPIEVLKDQILETHEMTAHPFGANIITLAPVYKDQLKFVCDMECEFIVFAGGIPKKNEIQQAKKAGAKVNPLKALLMTPNPS